MSVENDSSRMITRRLDALIRLVMEQQNKEGQLKRSEQLLILDSVGLTTGEIAAIVNQPSKDVSSSLRKLKKNQ